MINIKKSNSIFTELKSEDAASVNGGAFCTVEYLGDNNFLIQKFRNNGNLGWSAIVNNNGTPTNCKDDTVTFPPGQQPPSPQFVARRAKRKLKRFLKNG